MQFDASTGRNPIDQGTVIGRAVDRVDGPLKVTGRASYAYERNDVAPNVAYGYPVVSAIAKGRITGIDTTQAKGAPGVLTVVTTLDVPRMKGNFNTASLFGGPVVEHYHQAIAVVVAETFEQARAAASLVRVDYAREVGKHDLALEAKNAPLTGGNSNEGSAAPPVTRVGKFEEAFAAAPFKLDATYTTPDESHAMMEPHATTAAWQGAKLTIWTSNQMIAWTRGDLAKVFGLKPADVRVDSPYIGGGFGAKLFLRADAVLAAHGARAAKRPVKLALPRPLIANNTTHRPATIQRVRLAATPDGKLTAIAHESTSGNLPEGDPETATAQTRLLYQAPNRMFSLRLAKLDLPEGNAMRAPGEAPGMMALEVAMDELAEKLGMDPVEFRIINDTQVDPEKPGKAFSQRRLVECLRTGADRFGWSRRSVRPAQVRDGRWLVGMGMSVGFRNNINMASAARVRLDARGVVTVETDMTDIGTGSYTILAQTAAEMMGVGLEKVVVRLGDSANPTGAGSGGQWGANSSAAGVYAACVKLREEAAKRLGLDPAAATFADGRVTVGTRRVALADAARAGEIVVDGKANFGAEGKKLQQSTFAVHFCEVGVDAYTGVTRVRRMLAVCDAGRILNPKTARSQVIGGMTMGVGAALMEELAVDTRFGYFVNHDLAGYEVPVHADIPHQEVIFLPGEDAATGPMKAKGVGELGLCGVGAAVANAMYNATGVRLRDYPLTLEKHLERLPLIA
jgi:xanthine dehydrogenase YagR molybdenum-binding subunit